MVGISIPVVRSELVGQVGTPAQPAEYEWTWQVTGTVPNTTGLHPPSGAFQEAKPLDVLQCSDDVSPVPPNTMWPVSGSGRDGAKWSLTNYVGNAHVFMKFNGVRILSGSSSDPTQSNMGGRFPRANSSRVNSSGVIASLVLLHPQILALEVVPFKGGRSNPVAPTLLTA